MIIEIHWNQNHFWNLIKMCCHFNPANIKFYPIYTLSNLIFCRSICPISNPSNSSLFNNTVIIISSGVKISTINEEISAIPISIRSGIKSNISIISSRRFSRNIYFKRSFTTKSHCISSRTTAENSNFPIIYLIYRPAMKYMKKISIKSI